MSEFGKTDILTFRVWWGIANFGDSATSFRPTYSDGRLNSTKAAYTPDLSHAEYRHRREIGAPGVGIHKGRYIYVPHLG